MQVQAFRTQHLAAQHLVQQGGGIKFASQRAQALILMRPKGAQQLDERVEPPLGQGRNILQLGVDAPLVLCVGADAFAGFATKLSLRNPKRRSKVWQRNRQALIWSR